MSLARTMAMRFGTMEIKASKIRVASSTGLSVAISELAPILKGHCVVVPTKGRPERVSNLSTDEFLDLMRTVLITQKSIRAIRSRKTSIAFNISIKDGAAGQPVPHVHVHVVPRVKGIWSERRCRDD